MFLSFLISLTGCLVTGVQALLIYFQGEGVCFNDGCQVVESLTIVDPLIFNIVGFLFFLLAAIGTNRARSGSDIWKRFISLVLLAALAAEAVLFAFQILISQVFCSYCLIILALVILVNLFFGLKQLFKGFVIFCAVLIASFSLDYTFNSSDPPPLESGTMAYYQAPDSQHLLYLFFSSTCDHCESVIELLQDNRICSINFNPVDKITSFSFPNAEVKPEYKPETNLHLLKTLGIDEVPALLSKEAESITLLKGEQSIKAFIDQLCSQQSTSTIPQPTLQIQEQMSSSSALPLIPEDDGCSVEEDCLETSDQTSQSRVN